MSIIRSPSNCRCSLWFPNEIILRLNVASSWVFYLSDFGLCRPLSRTVIQLRGEVVRYSVPYIIKPNMHLQMYHQCVNIYHVTFISVDIWLAVHHSIIFFITNLIHKFLVHLHKLHKVKFLYMFQTQSSHHQEVNDANCTYAASGIVTLCK